jgi:hypothetical protein
MGYFGTRIGSLPHESRVTGRSHVRGEGLRAARLVPRGHDRRGRASGLGHDGRPRAPRDRALLAADQPLRGPQRGLPSCVRTRAARRRATRWPDHGDRVARKAAGLELSLIDNDVQLVGSLDDGDQRAYRVRVAGP